MDWNHCFYRTLLKIFASASRIFKFAACHQRIRCRSESLFVPGIFLYFLGYLTPELTPRIAITTTVFCTWIVRQKEVNSTTIYCQNVPMQAPFHPVLCGHNTHRVSKSAIAKSSHSKSLGTQTYVDKLLCFVSKTAMSPCFLSSLTHLSCGTLTDCSGVYGLWLKTICLLHQRIESHSWPTASAAERRRNKDTCEAHGRHSLPNTRHGPAPHAVGLQVA